MKFLYQVMFVLALLLFSQPTAAVESSIDGSFSRFKSGVTRFTLSNGLTVVVFKRGEAPVFAGQLWVKVGGVDEVAGTTGVSHMLEHMAFKGSQVIGTKDFAKEQPLLQRYELLQEQLQADPKNTKLQDEIKTLRTQLETLWESNEFTRLYKQRGAVDINAATGKDYTFYMVEVPNNAFDFWCWMESDRLLHPVFRQFYEEREVVMEERRSRTDDDPEGFLYEIFMASSYVAHPYRLPTIGWRSDVQNLKLADMESLYKRYYVPSNMVLVLVGDLDLNTIRAPLERYFGRIPAAPEPVPTVRTVEPEQTGPRDIVVHFPASPSFFLAYPKPTYPNKDDAYFAVLHGLLADGRSSILYKELVEKQQLAASISTGEAPGERFDSMFYFFATPKQGVSNAQLRSEIEKIIVRMSNAPIPAADINAAKRRIAVSFLKGLSSNSGIASSLGRTQLLWGDWNVLFEVYERMLETTEADLHRLLKTYFNPAKTTYVHLETIEESKR